LTATHFAVKTPPNPWELAGRVKAKLPSREGLLRHSIAWFLGALVLMFVTAPFIEELPNGKLIEAVLLTTVLGTAVLAVGGRRRTLVLASLLVSPALVARWLHHFNHSEGAYSIHFAAFMVFLGFVVFEFLRFILRAPHVNSEVLCAAVATYLLLGLLWGSAYILLARMMPGSFSGLPASAQPLHGFEAMYFSLITLTTVGYGDIVPVSGPARMLAMLEAITGTTYMAVLVARLVSAYSSTPAAPSEPDH